MKVENEMATKVSVDTLSAIHSMAGLKAAVSAANNEWKAHATQLKSVGDNLGAAKAKFEGLGDTITAQKAKLAELKRQQDEVDTSSDKGAVAYAKLEKSISQATNQLASYEAQQRRAKQSVDYYTSGLSDLQKGYKQAQDVSKSYVARLEAEGHQEDAQKAKLSGLKSGLVNLSEQYAKQEAELKRIAFESGATSDAYAKQKVRVNETATALAKSKTEMTDLQSEMRKTDPSIFSTLREKIVGVNDQTEKGSGLMKKFIGAGLITNAVSSAWTSFSNGVKETVTSGLELAEAGEKSAAAWSAMGKSEADVKSLGSQVAELNTKSGITISNLGQMQKTIDTMTKGNTDQTEAITAGIAGIGTASRLSGDQVLGLTKSMTRAVASGELTSSTLARMEKTAPALGASLASAAGVSQKAFSDMVANGQISSDKFLDLIAKAGQNTDGVYKEFGKTAEGAKAQMSASWDQLKKKMAAPLLDVNNSGMSQLASLMSSSIVQQSATDLGNALKSIAEHTKDVLTYLAEHRADVTGSAKDLVTIAKIAGGEVWSIFATVIQHVGQFFGISAKNADALKNPLGAVHSVLDKIVKNKEGIQNTVKVIAGLWMAKKAWGFATALGGVYSQLRNLANSELFSKIAGNFSTLSKSEVSTPTVTTGATTEVGTAAISTSRAMSLTKGAGNVAAIGTAIDLGGSVVKSLTSPTAKNKIATASKATGTLVGGGIGGALGSIVGPEGALAGAKIGSAIGDALGSTKTAKSWAKSIAKSYHNATAGLKVPSPKIDVDDKALGNSFTKASKTLSKKLVVSMSTDPKTLAKSAASVNSTYAKMQKSVDSYYKKKEASSAKDLQKLVNNGQMTQAQADKSLKKQKAADAAEAKSKKAAYAAMQKDASAYYTKAQTIANGGTKKLQSLAQKYGKNSEQYEKEKNKELLAAYKSYANSSVKAQMQNNSKITSTVKAGASQQTKLLEKLTKEKGKLSNEQLTNTAKNAKKEYDAAVKPARQSRNDIKAAAEDRYKSSKATAEHEYKDLKSITKSQYEDAKQKALDQKHDVTNAADDQYKKVTKHAYNQYQSVKDAITKQQKAVVEQARQQQVGSNDYAANQSKSVVNHAIKQANSSMDASSKQARGTGNIFGGLLDWWNKFNKAVGGDEVKTSKGSYNYSQIGGPAYGYASGGSVSATSKALVGEAGPELRYSPYSKTVDVLGAHGAQFADVRSGEYILNAKDTARLMAGTYGGTLPGYASGTSGLDDFIKKIKSGASNIMDKISDTAVSMFDAITHPVDTLKNLAAKIFDVKSVPKVGTLAQSASGGMRDKSIDWVAKAFTKLKDAVDNSDLKNPSGSGVDRWKPYVIKALKANHFEATASRVSAWMRVIQRESNGNPKAINLWDSNAKKGIPSMGLVQTIKPTFEAYKFKGHNDIYNGYDDLLAGIAYMAAKYGRGASAFTRVSGPEGYANGGIVNGAQYRLTGEAGPELIMPMSPSKASRSWQLLTKAVNQINGGAATVGTDNSDVLAEMNAKFDRLLAMFAQLLGLSADQITAIQNSGMDMPTMYKKMAKDQRLHDMQAF